MYKVSFNTFTYLSAALVAGGQLTHIDLRSNAIGQEGAANFLKSQRILTLCLYWYLI